MKKFYGSVLFLFVASFAALAQDEGAIIKKERIALSKNIYVAVGPSITFGKNIGDYNKGLAIEAGYLTRINRVLSLGGQFSYTRFKYDPKETTAKSDAYIGQGDPNGYADDYNVPANFSYYYGWVLNLKGGDLSMASLGFTVKINFIPVKDDTKFSIYAFAKPFIASASRTAVSGTGERYAYETYESNDVLYYNTGDETWYKDRAATDTWGPDDYDALKAKNVVTGGIFIGPGIEFMPAQKLSFFAQAAFGYTLPVDYVSTKSYPPTYASYIDPKFPIVKKGFPALNIQAGLSFNF